MMDFNLRARFLFRQPKVRWTTTGDYVHVIICLNEKKFEQMIDDINEGKIIEHFYEYDYNEFVDEKGKLFLEHVESNPEQYIGYQP